MRAVSFAMHGIAAEVITPQGNGSLQLALIGKFNLANSLAVLAALLAAGFTLPNTIAALAAVKPVPGRMQLVELANEHGDRCDSNITVVVDYAHTPDALALALQALRPHAQAALRVVFGAGGDRDSGKRPLMGAVAEEHADSVILTSDNPRGERPAAIIADIRAGMRAPQAAHVESDRGIAIAHAIESADSGDIVLIAGKGHEAEQIIGDERIPFSDCDIARRELQRRFAA
ncbi:MAG: hypothetical protein HKO07_00210 [Pseudomonadales bacterium]|nr:hypothetical protein [Pseudomonadales bacterium]